ncbi:MAG: tyrosine-type recombinase/integrase [Hyphomicrobiales bacterium]|nr:tyrosine-type recombinase/integrase [Hyphomicrobiales bacterium]
MPRHGFATAMLQARVDPVSVAKLGGWESSQQVFATYGHATDDMTVTDRLFDTPVTQAPIRGQKRHLKTKG